MIVLEYTTSEHDIKEAVQTPDGWEFVSAAPYGRVVGDSVDIDTTPYQVFTWSRPSRLVARSNAQEIIKLCQSTIVDGSTVSGALSIQGSPLWKQVIAVDRTLSALPSVAGDGADASFAEVERDDHINVVIKALRRSLDQGRLKADGK